MNDVSSGLPKIKNLQVIRKYKLAIIIIVFVSSLPIELWAKYPETKAQRGSPRWEVSGYLPMPQSYSFPGGGLVRKRLF